jgi:multidrug efflux pump subunit AcrA (membrane-fusion protein)
VTKTGEDVWYSGDTSDMAPQVEAAINAYVDESHTKAMAVLPLFQPHQPEEGIGEKTVRQPPRVIGALLVEQMVDARTPDGFLQRVEVVRSHSATALTNALEHEGLFLLPLWRFLGRGTRFFRGQALPKTIAASTALFVTLLVLCFWPWDFALQGEGRFRPTIRRNIFAGVDEAVVDRVLVQDGQLVKKGDLLVEMSSIDLQTERENILGQLNSATSKIAAIGRELSNNAARDMTINERSQKQTEKSQYEANRISLQKQLDLIEKKTELLHVPSPIDGQVVSWQVRQQLENRPVSRQQILMEVVDPTSDWELEIFMPESRMGHVQREWEAARKENRWPQVTFFSAQSPEKKFTGEVVDIDLAADARGDKGNSVRLRVRFDQDSVKSVIKDLKVNSEATAKVHCGKRPIGYVYLHDLIDFIRSKILFRL